MFHQAPPEQLSHSCLLLTQLPPGQASLWTEERVFGGGRGGKEFEGGWGCRVSGCWGVQQRSRQAWPHIAPLNPTPARPAAGQPFLEASLRLETL